MRKGLLTVASSISYLHLDNVIHFIGVQMLGKFEGSPGADRFAKAVVRRTILRSASQRCRFRLATAMGLRAPLLQAELTHAEGLPWVGDAPTVASSQGL